MAGGTSHRNRTRFGGAACQRRRGTGGDNRTARRTARLLGVNALIVRQAYDRREGEFETFLLRPAGWDSLDEVGQERINREA